MVVACAKARVRQRKAAPRAFTPHWLGGRMLGATGARPGPEECIGRDGSCAACSERATTRSEPAVSAPGWPMTRTGAVAQGYDVPFWPTIQDAGANAPRRPSALSPQQNAAPAGVNAQVFSCPTPKALSAVANGPPDTGRGVGLIPLNEPSPSRLPSPQQ